MRGAAMRVVWIAPQVTHRQNGRAARRYCLRATASASESSDSLHAPLAPSLAKPARLRGHPLPIAPSLAKPARLRGHPLPSCVLLRCGHRDDHRCGLARACPCLRHALHHRAPSTTRRTSGCSGCSRQDEVCALARSEWLWQTRLRWRCSRPNFGETACGAGNEWPCYTNRVCLPPEIGCSDRRAARARMHTPTALLAVARRVGRGWLQSFRCSCRPTREVVVDARDTGGEDGDSMTIRRGNDIIQKTPKVADISGPQPAKLNPGIYVTSEPNAPSVTTPSLTYKAV